ncbi:MAG: tetratricopeptide repeat protein [Acidobacteriota bacterium]
MPADNQLGPILEKAELAYHQGNYPDAIRFWEEALALDPNNGRAKEGIQMAKLLVEAGGTVADKVLAQVQSEKQNDAGSPGESPGADLKKIRDQFEQGDLEGAASHCRLYLKRRPDDQEAKNLLQLMEQNLETDKDVREHVAKGYEYLQAGNREEAERESQQALIINGSHAGALELHRRVSQPATPAPGPVMDAVPAETAGDDPVLEPTLEETLPPQPAADSVPMNPPAAKPEPEPEPPMAMPESLEPPTSPQPEPSTAGAPAAAAGVTADANADLELIGEGGTQYGKWVDEFSSLDMDAAAETVGKETPPETPKAPAKESGTAPAGFDPTTSEFEMPEDVASIPLATQTEPSPAPTKVAGAPEFPPPMAGESGSKPDAEAMEPASREKPAWPRRAPTPVPQRPAPRRTSSRAGLIVVILFLGAATAGAWFLLKGTGFSLGRGEENPGSTPVNSGPGPDKSPVNLPPPPGAVEATGNPEGTGEPTAGANPQAESVESSDSVASLSPAARKNQARDLIRSGKELYRKGDTQQAYEQLQAALILEPINFELKDLIDEIGIKIEEEKKAQREIDSARRAFDDFDYANALRKLYRLPGAAEAEPNRTYIRNAWFNWGIQLLQAGNCREARERFQEVLGIRAGDPEATKLKSIADRYRKQAKDTFFYNFVGNLELKTIDSP